MYSNMAQYHRFYHNLIFKTLILDTICAYEAISAKSRKRFYWSKDGPTPDLAGAVINVFKPLSGRFKNYVTGIYKPGMYALNLHIQHYIYIYFNDNIITVC